MKTFVSTFSLQTERLSPHHKTKEQMLHTHAHAVVTS